MDRYRSTRTEWLPALQNYPPDSSDPSATQPGEDPVNADDVEDSPSPEDLPTENQDGDPTDLIEDTLATDADSLSDIPDEDPISLMKTRYP